MSRLDDELALLREEFPDLEFLAEGQWVRFPSYLVPAELWKPSTIQLAFQIPPQMATAPYAFHVRPLADDPLDRIVAATGADIRNFSYPATTPWGADWATFSWGVDENAWFAAEPLRSGSTMLQFARTFADRFAEGP